MKFIKPIVGISKIIDTFDNVICGFNGVLSKGNNINVEALHALNKCIEAQKNVVVLSNSYLRIKDMVEIVSQADSLLVYKLKAIITAGEILHYMLKNPDSLGLKGTTYYNLGLKEATAVFENLGYTETKDIAKADFIFMGAVKNGSDMVENYTQELEFANSLGLDFLCIGNDTATYSDGEVCLGSGAVAEQYALLGGKVITIGKPDIKMVKYALECFGGIGNTLFIGDSFTTDIKAANTIEAQTVLISKGIHVNFLGEGYIPDVEKTRIMAQEYEVYPDYVISGLRW
ncbi:MAG: hypothetical protein E7016_00970 [Alphaproteobacteria bacterium]|nr:hypothetical protein [Alphaproteobacteria bacterium]